LEDEILAIVIATLVVVVVDATLEAVSTCLKKLNIK